jgi:hypothetical protein
MTIHDDLAAIRTRRATTPDTPLTRELAARGLTDDALNYIQQLEIATRSIAAAIDGEVGNPDWPMAPYLEDKAEAAERAAGQLRQLAELAREMPPAP